VNISQYLIIKFGDLLLHITQ